MAYLTHVHGQVHAVAEVDNRLDGSLGRFASVTVAGVHYLVVELGVLERLEITVPLRTAQQDDVVVVHLADGGYTFLIYIFQLAVEFLHVLEVRSNGLVEEFVTEDDRFVLVAVGYPAPDVTVELLADFAVEQPGIAVAVVDVVARLSAGGVVHVEDEVQVRFAAPLYQAVHAGKAVLVGSQPHIVLVRKQFVMERQADGVGTLLLDEADVLARHIIVLECFPEVGGKVRSHQLAEHLVDETARVGLAEPKHVSFRIQPVAQVGTHDEEFGTVGLYQVLTLNGYECIRSYFFCRLFLTASRKAQRQQGDGNACR